MSKKKHSRVTYGEAIISTSQENFKSSPVIMFCWNSQQNETTIIALKLISLLTHFSMSLFISFFKSFFYDTKSRSFNKNPEIINKLAAVGYYRLPQSATFIGGPNHYLLMLQISCSRVICTLVGCIYLIALTKYRQLLFWLKKTIWFTQWPLILTDSAE